MNHSLPPRAPNEAARIPPIRTLLVDDVENIRALIESYLKRRGICEVVGHADNGEKAVALTRQLRPDLVIMDVRMPVMNGVEATRQIKQLPNPPRIIIVSLCDASTERLALRAGADAFCSKQTVLNTLADHIAAVCGPPV
jgi:DNA-binding NarL/FixJ family response regulator